MKKSTPKSSNIGKRRSNTGPSEHRAEAVIDFLEAAYRMDLDDATWLRGVVEAALAVWGRSNVANAVLYDASDIANFKIVHAHLHNIPEAARDVLFTGVSAFTPAYVARNFRSTLIAAGRATSPELKETFDVFRELGLPDCLSLNGLDPTGHGAYLALMTREPLTRVPEPATFRRMAHHLGAAYRCRRRLAAQAGAPDLTLGAEAILDGQGELVHAEGEATGKASQTSILQAARVRARALAREPEGAHAVQFWHPLTQARWTLVDTFTTGGERYVVARENQARVGGLDSLSERERQVVAYVALGQSSKEAAYALGIADSTARVLLARAIAKLGVRSRAELCAHPDVCSLSQAHGAPERDPAH